MPSFAPEVIFYLGSFPVTNTILNTLLVDFIIIGFALLASRKLAEVPTKLQNFTEYVVESAYNLTSSIAGNRANMIFPFFMTFFLFIFIANFTNLIPGINTFGVQEGKHLTPFLRGTTSDLNTTLSLAIISLTATHAMSIKTLGITEYLSRFIPFFPFFISVLRGKPKFAIDKSSAINIFMSLLNPFILVFVGILELISEFVKLISLSFRLFGNIYAGEVVLHTISNFFAFVAPIPFLMLEVIVGFVQALVFSMLTMVFMVLLTTSHHDESEGVKA